MTSEEQEMFEELEDLCRSKGFIHVIPYFYFRDHVIGYNENGLTPENLGNLYSWSRITRAEINLLIGLILRGPIDFSLPSPDKLSEYLKRSEEILTSIHTNSIRPNSTLNKIDNDTPPSDLREIGESIGKDLKGSKGIREASFYAMESAYGYQFSEFAVEKYSKDSEWIFQKKRISLDVGRDICNAVGVILDRKVTEREIFDIDLLTFFTFTCEEIASHTGHSNDSVKLFIDTFTFPENDRNVDFISKHEYNKIIAYPFIRRSSDEVILFHPLSLAESFYDTPFFWMIEDKSYKDKALRHRGEFTEDVAFAKFSSVFNGHTYRNVKIYCNRNRKTELGEIDVLVVFGHLAIVLQCKSKRLTLKARSGDTKAFQEDFERAIGDAVNQANSCGELLFDSSVFLIDNQDTKIELDTTLTTVYPLAVVSDHFPGLAFQVWNHLDFKPTDKIPAPFVTDIFTLDLISEFLNSPLKILSYLKLHARFYDRMVADHEIVVLGYHLENNLWINSEWDSVYFDPSFCSCIDIAVAARKHGMPGPKTPEGILTWLNGTIFEKIIPEMENNPTPERIEFGLFLLQLGREGIVNINNQVSRILEITGKDKQIHGFSIPFESESKGLTINCGVNDRESAEWLWQFCLGRKYASRSDHWFGVSLYPDGSPRLAIALDDPWEYDENMEGLIAEMPTDTLSFKSDTE